MRYIVFVAFNAILLPLASVDCRKIVLGGIVPTWDEYEDPDIEDDDQCSQEVKTELAKIRADLRSVKSLVEGLRQKLDPDFKPVETETPTAEPGPCPEGFEHLSEARGCYKVITERYDWSSAMEQCRSLNPNAHLIAINSREESEDVTKYLKKQLASRKTRNSCIRPNVWPPGHAGFWTSGQRVNMSDCSSEFVWKTTAEGEAPFSYTQWISGEPNCYEGDEKCAELLVSRRSDWNDLNCLTSSCPLCEYDLN